MFNKPFVDVCQTLYKDQDNFFRRYFINDAPVFNTIFNILFKLKEWFYLFLVAEVGSYIYSAKFFGNLQFSDVLEMNNSILGFSDDDRNLANRTAMVYK